MPKKRSTFKLGVVVIIMFALFLFCLMTIGSGMLLNRPRGQVVVRFGPGVPLPELQAGALVMYFGQKIGVVQDTRVVQDTDPDDATIRDQHFLEVAADLYKDIDLRRDCVIQASGPPLGGGGMLVILNRGVSTERIEAGQPIYGESSGFQAALEKLTHELDGDNPDGLLAKIKLELDATAPQSLMTKMHTSISDMNAVTSSLAVELDRERAGVMIQKVHAAFDGLQEGLQQVINMLKENRPKVDRTLTSLDDTAAKLNTQVVGVIARELELDQESDATLRTKMHEAMNSLGQALNDATVVTDGVKEIVVVNKARIGQTMENINQASLSLKQAIKDIKLHPWKVFLKPSPATRRELQLFNVAREFADAAAHLDRCTARLQGLLDANGGQVARDDPRLREVRADLSDTIERFNAAEYALWNQLGLD